MPCLSRVCAPSICTDTWARLYGRSLHKKDVHGSFLSVQAAWSKSTQERCAWQFPYCAGSVLEVYTRKMCLTVSLPCRLCARSLHKKDVRDSFLTVQAVCSQFPYRAGCVLEVYTRKMCATVFLPRGRSLHTKDVRDNFLTVHSKFTQEKMCVTVSLQCRLCARSLHKKDARDSFLTMQAVWSKFTQERCA